MRIVFSPSERLSGAPEPARSALTPWLASGALGLEECVTAAELMHLYGEDSAVMALLLALVLRSPDEGHSCLRLNEVRERLEAQRERTTRSATRIEQDESGQLTLYSGSAAANVRVLDALPEVPPREALIEALRRSPLCTQAGALTEGLPRTPLVLIDNRLYGHRYAQAEVKISVELTLRARERKKAEDPTMLHRWIPPQARRAQREAVLRTGDRSLLFLTGGPGTGKTWTVRNVLAARLAAAAAAGEPPPRIALAAPTGKAAARMGESLAARLADWQDGLRTRSDVPAPDKELLTEITTRFQHLKASTIHRLLGYRRSNPTRFRHNRDNPIPADIIVVDEVSMVDTLMMARLLDACAANALLVLIGDPDQLASVDAGSVLSDIVDAAQSDPDLTECHVHLDESQRFDDEKSVGKLTRWVLEGGEGPTPSVHWHPVGNEQLPDDTVAALARPFVDLAALARGWSGTQVDVETLRERARQGLALLDRYRILTARRSGNYGVGSLNQLVVQHLRDEGLIPTRASAGRPFVGMPLLVLENGYGVGRFNGDIGLMVASDAAAFENAEGGFDFLSPTRLPRHQAAWAMTIHKSQGSEFDRVCVVLPPEESRLHTRELLYTAVSRARHEIELVANESTIRQCAARRISRASGLREVFAALSASSAAALAPLSGPNPMQSVSAHYR